MPALPYSEAGSGVGRVQALVMGSFSAAEVQRCRSKPMEPG